MTKPSRAVDFLENMAQDITPAAPPAVQDKAAKEMPQKPTSNRSGLKHIGGYFDVDTVEKVAILRARLSRDNSELIKLAVDDLYSKHMAKRAFGDA
jgi:hypothetical protein